MLNIKFLKEYGVIVLIGENNCFASRRLRVQVPLAPLKGHTPIRYGNILKGRLVTSTTKVAMYAMVIR